jgi:hypothetical protein
VWPALAIAGASAAFVSALDNPTQFVTDKVSLTGTEDAATPATVLGIPPLITTPLAATPTVPGAAGPAPIPSTIPPVPVAAASTPGACDAPPIDGSVVQTRWGPVQVQAQLTSDRVVCNVVVLQAPNSRNRSVRINNYATPILHDQAIAAGNAQFNGVSGATITSRGYAASLQSIIDNS